MSKTMTITEDTPSQERIQRWSDEIEILIASHLAAAQAGKAVSLGRVGDLVPSGADALQVAPRQDQLWFTVLRATTERYGLIYRVLERIVARDIVLMRPDHPLAATP